MAKKKARPKHKSIWEQQICANCRARAWCAAYNPKFADRKKKTK